MNYEERLQNVAVLGAAGKMGSGILLLTAVEMADLWLKPENRSKTFVLHAIDISQPGLAGLMRYLRAQVTKIAEKKAVQLRAVYADCPDLIENYDIIARYVEDVMSVIRPVTTMESAYTANIVFEAASENQDLKVKLLKTIDINNPGKPWFFTNTSSIPIHVLEKEAGLEGRILGFHFYNPPAVQKLAELIITPASLPDMVAFAKQYARNLRKVIVPSNDFAGFIGNGHFMRDALHGIREAERLAPETGLAAAVFLVNKITQEYLVRPMGIFQLIDYVGIDVVQFIMKVMNPYLKDEDLHSDLLDRMMESGVKGGQNSDGSQKDGFLKYEKGKVTGVYDPEKKQYIVAGELQETCAAWAGATPGEMPAWKAVVGNKEKMSILARHFDALKDNRSKGAELALNYLKRSKEIGQKLVSDGVAASPDDVNTVLLTGFFHAYGPINDFI